MAGTGTGTNFKEQNLLSQMFDITVCISIVFKRFEVLGRHVFKSAKLTSSEQGRHRNGGRHTHFRHWEDPLQQVPSQ